MVFEFNGFLTVGELLEVLKDADVDARVRYSRRYHDDTYSTSPCHCVHIESDGTVLIDTYYNEYGVLCQPEVCLDDFF